ncbi:MAG: molybdopterin-dependent oxidoreductase [Planctomycetota bacterium]
MTAPDVRSTYCTLDCPDTCGLLVTVEDGRVTRIQGDRRLPLTAGFVCEKVGSFAEQVESQERVRVPRLRRGAKGQGRFRDASWEEALELVATRLGAVAREHGGEAIVPLAYGGSNGLLTDGATDEILWRGLGASRVARTICAVPTTLAARHMYGGMRGVAFEDYERAGLIVLWGVNPAATGIHLVPILKRARERGAQLVVVDPRRTQLARRAELHVQLRPASDLALALGVARALFHGGHADEAFLAEHVAEVELFRERAERWTPDLVLERTGLRAATFDRFVELYATLDPAVIRAGWGLERNRHGGSAVCAVLALPAVAGKFRTRGGGYTLSQGGEWSFAAPTDRPKARSRVINMNRIGRALVDGEPPVRALFVYNMNPAMTVPDAERFRRGLEREDLFTVVLDPILTDTARYADVVLPATTFFEHRDLRKSYGTGALVRSLPVIEPVGDSRSNQAVFGALAERLGFVERAPTDDELEARLLAQYPGARTQLDEGEPAWTTGGPAPAPFHDAFPPTPDGRVHLVPAALEAESRYEELYTWVELPSDARFPLTLLSPAEATRISSTFGQRYREEVALALHADDLAARGLVEGDAVRVFNELGEVWTTVREGPHLMPGTVELPKGLWAHNTANGRTSNALVPDHLSDLGGGACFNDARVEVEARDAAKGP